jgi:hypothetical protein
MSTSSKICPRCGCEVGYLTRDHIVPRSLMDPLEKIFKFSSYVTQKKNNIQEMCYECNSWKTNKIDWYHPHTRHVMAELYDMIGVELEKHEHDHLVEIDGKMYSKEEIKKLKTYIPE